MATVFISYRRADSAAISGRIYDRLRAEFGKDAIFKDVDNIPAGSDFRGVLREATAHCKVMLVIIGQRWVTIDDGQGNRRLDNLNDFVRIEIETGLQRDTARVIPVLVGGAGMPAAHDLPDTLRELAFKNAVPVRDDPDFHRDVDRLVAAIRPFIEAPTPTPMPVVTPPEANPRKRSKPNPTIVVAVITGIFAILAAVIGIIPSLLQQSRDTAATQAVENTFIAETQAVFSNETSIAMAIISQTALAATNTPSPSPTHLTATPTPTATDAPTATSVNPTQINTLTVDEQALETVNARATDSETIRRTTATEQARLDGIASETASAATQAAQATADVLTQVAQATQNEIAVKTRVAELQATIETWTPSPTATYTPSDTPTSTYTPSKTSTNTPTASSTPSRTNTPTATYPASRTPHPTNTPTPINTLTALEAARQPMTSNSQWQRLYPDGFVQEFDGIPMVLVPAGCFTMGNDAKALYSIYTTERQWVTGVPSGGNQCFDTFFWIDQTEVTQADFVRLGGRRSHTSYSKGSERPVDSVNWSEAAAFCEKRDGRLPTEAEWEYAARGPDELIYPWGNEWNVNNAVWNRTDVQGSANVGENKAGKSWVGAFDMSGNVWEWTANEYQPYPYQANSERNSSNQDVLYRVGRGGAWLNTTPDNLRAAGRLDFEPDNPGNTGFRCVRNSN
jgi:formylglycine-generating enzyme required for sulfatase activity